MHERYRGTTFLFSFSFICFPHFLFHFLKEISCCFIFFFFFFFKFFKKVFFSFSFFLFFTCYPRSTLTCVLWQTSLSKYTHMVASLPLDLLLLVLSFCSGDDVNIMPPLSVVNHAIYQSSHTNRKRISALKNPPFNIARPSLAKNLKLYSDSMMVFVHACESGVFLPTLRDLDIHWRTMKCIMKFIIQVTLIFREWGLVLILGSHNGQCTVHNAARNPTGMMTTEPDDEHYAVHNPAHESPQSELMQCIMNHSAFYSVYFQTSPQVAHAHNAETTSIMQCIIRHTRVRNPSFRHIMQCIMNHSAFCSVYFQTSPGRTCT